MMTDRRGRDRYTVDRPLGHGAMGTVHLARDTILDRVVAVKILAGHLAADEAFRRRFLQEARLAARLCHPNIVQVFDASDDDGQPFLVMEYVDGVTVAERVAGRGGFAAGELTGLAIELSAALAQAHAQGIVHRDVKPHNVILRRDGVAKLTDFGIARAVEEQGLTEIGTVLGTPPYMAPEQAAGRAAGAPADVYALGALLRYAAAGPLPPALAFLVDAVLADDPDARPTAAEVHARLAAAADRSTAVVLPGRTGAPEMALTGTGRPESAPTARRPRAGTEMMPASKRPSGVRLPERCRRFAGRRATVIAAVLVAVVVLAGRLGGSDHTAATPTPVTAGTTAVTADPAQAAHDFAGWLRSQAGR
ncbi:MAG TPA: serine/threonine-protein kinase [Acidimicrobiia bacterium]|nr:serine/threonine-protein kinase [Acidimicrobiia bacterium]